MRKHPRGYASIWFLVVVAAIAGAIGVTAILGGIQSGNLELKELGFGLAGFSALALLAGIVYEARRDFYRFCGVAGFVLIFSAVGAFEAGLADSDKDGQLGGFLFAGILTALSIASFIYVFRLRRAKDTLPDPLREQFKPGQIYEEEGVQFAYSPQGKTIKLLAGETQIVTVVAQNCFDAERVFSFGIEQEGRVSFNSAGLEFQKLSTLTLAPLAAGQLTIPVRADLKAKGSYALLLTPNVTGAGGARVRKPRGRGFSKKSSGWFLLLGHIGHLMNAMRPRLRFAVKAPPKEQLGFDGPPVAAALAVPTSTILWKSDQHADSAQPGSIDIPQVDRFGIPLAKAAKPRSPAPTAIAASLLLIAASAFALYKIGDHENQLEAQEDAAPGGVVGGVVGEEKKPAFDAEKDLKIAMTKEPGSARGPTFRLVTDGLNKHDRRELEMIGVPAPLVAPSKELMQVLADSTVNESELHAGDAWGGSVYGFDLAAQLVAVKSNKAVLRIADVDDEQGARPARMFIAAGAVKQARSLFFDKKGTESLALIRAALDFYPGTPGAGPEGYEDRNINQNDNLAWLAFSQLGKDTDRSFQAALLRSEVLRSIELGGAQPATVSREALIKDARTLVLALQASGPVPAPAIDGRRQLDPGFSWQLGPVLSFTDGALTRRARVDKVEALTYYYIEPAKSALLNPEVLALAADIYIKYQNQPLQLLTLLREPIDVFYEAGFDFLSKHQERPAPTITLAAKDNQHLPMLSRILAALGRQLAAGETLPELRADWDLSKDAKALASAGRKMSALEEKE